MKFGSDQTLARDLNVQMVLKLLKENYLSNSDLAREMKLSKAALTKIMSEMLEQGLVQITENGENVETNVGRKKTYYKINPHVGMVGVVNFAPTHIQIVLSDINGKTIDKVNIYDKEFIDETTLNETIDHLKRLRDKHENSKRQLLSLCVAAPGQINKYTQEFLKSPKFKQTSHFKLRDLFKDAFNVKASLKNDINLCLLGEKEKGLMPQGIEDAILVHIDTGVGGAILNKNKIVEGEQGFAGEFGLNKTFDKFGNIVYFDSLCSTNAIKNQINYYKTIGEETSLQDGFKLNDVIQAYHNGDSLVRTIVLDTAKNISVLIHNLYHTFDCEHIFISGRIKGFGDDYLKTIKSNLDKTNTRINLQYTECGDEAITYGALSVAIDDAFQHLVESRKKHNGKEHI